MQDADLTALLQQVSTGDKDAEARLMPLIYRELHRVASAQLRRERPGHTLQPTALVHEVYLKLTHQKNVDWKDRAHFFAVASRGMRQILVDHARRKGAEKRGGQQVHLPLDEGLAISEQ